MVVNTNSSDSLSSEDFVHLHCHTHYSLLDGLTKVDELIDFVKKSGMKACALTDHGTMSGALDFYKEATKNGIKPIIGYEAYVAARKHTDRDPQKDKSRYHLTMLAMNNQGYQNLMVLSSTANLEGMYYKPRIDHDLIKKYNDGIIVLSGCPSGELAYHLKNDDYEGAKEVAKWYKSIFGDRYYIELQDDGNPKAPKYWPMQAKINRYATQISNELGIKRVVTCDCHYLRADDEDAHEILLCVGTGSYLSDANRMTLRDFDLHVTDPKELIARWKDIDPEAIRDTRMIADRCDVNIKFGQILIPKFPTPNGQPEKDYFYELVYKGMAERYCGKNEEEAKKMSVDDVRGLLGKEQLDRLDMELDVIDKMGYNGYFLIVQDFINWGKSHDIVFGPGRGSAAGSIIAYALNITELDPLKYDLLFERFLNPDRISMPDIDTDIQDTRRDEVIEYCSQKYGKGRVCNIATFGTMASRGAVRDVARVLQVPYAEADRLSKMIPPPQQGHHIPLAKCIKEDPDLNKEYNTNPTSKKVFDYAIRLEGTIRSHGIHAAGVVIAPDDLVKYVPLEIAQKGVISTQYPFAQVEEMGLLKMDFLGLSNLTIIQNTLDIIKKTYNTKIILNKIPLDDKKTFELLQRGDTTGVFQLESAGMKRYLKILQPTEFDDIIAMVALYRPGPMQFIDSFIRRKHGEEKITYLAPAMENALKSTYGIMVYQEQFMQISKDWCGFTGGQADTLRKAVGKKKISLMRKLKIDFVKGAIKKSGATEEVANKFWAQLEDFANYCFNKAHACCYALIAYWTAYLKAYFPDAFMAALMTSDKDDTDRLAIEISECQRMGINVLAPDVNESFVEFAVTPDHKNIRFGMAAVKGVGVGAVEEVLAARKDGGRFADLSDFISRVSSSKFNRKAWESLTRAGGFDEFADRSDILYNLDSITDFSSKVHKDNDSGQIDLFSMLSDSSKKDTTRAEIKLTPAPTKYSQIERLKWERELLGLYISAHPLDDYKLMLSEQAMPIEDLKPSMDGLTVVIGGLVSNIRTIMTKSNTKMAFVGIEDKTGHVETIVFPNLFSQIGQSIVQDAIVLMHGTVNAKDRMGNITDEIKIIVNDVKFITEEDVKNYKITGMKPPMPVKAKVSTSRRKYALQNNLSASHSSIFLDKKNEQTTPPKIRRLYARVIDYNNKNILNDFRNLCLKHAGLTDVILILGDDKTTAMKLPFKVDGSNDLIGELSKKFGEKNVILK